MVDFHWLSSMKPCMDTALVLSPATTFMSATQYSFKDLQTGDMTLTFGPMSSVEEVNLTSYSCNMLVKPLRTAETSSKTCPHACTFTESG